MKLTYCKFDFQQQSFWLSQCLDIINSLAKIIIVYVYWFGFLPNISDTTGGSVSLIQ